MIRTYFQLVKQALPHIYKTLTKLSCKLVELADKESSESDDSELSDDEYEKALRKLGKIREKNEAKDAAKESGMEDAKEGEEESDDDIEIDDDNEMQKEAGDFRLYYSPLDTVHELYYVKTKLEGTEDNNKNNRIGTEGYGNVQTT